MEITEQEQELIAEFKKNLGDLCIDKHHLEARNLVRFLRARNQNLENAETMFRRHMEWREEHDVDNITQWQYPKEYKEYWPWYLSGFDDKGGPVIILPVGLWDASKVGLNYNEFVRYVYHSIESMWKVVQYKSEGQKTFKQFSVIVDLKNLSLRTVTTIDAMQGVMNGVRVFESCYPETLGVGFLINAPYVFEIAWRLIKPFVSEHTHSKLRFLGSDQRNWENELAKCMTPDQFPAKYGGSLPDSCEIKILNGRPQIKGSNHTNSNDYICANLMRA